MSKKSIGLFVIALMVVAVGAGFIYQRFLHGQPQASGNVVPASIEADAAKSAVTGSIVYPKPWLFIKNRITDSDKVVVNGRAEPNSTITVYLYSNPVSRDVQVDSSGNWSAIFSPVATGSHHVEVVYASDPTATKKTIATFKVVSSLSGWLMLVGGVVFLIIIITIISAIVRSRKKNFSEGPNFTVPVDEPAVTPEPIQSVPTDLTPAETVSNPALVPPSAPASEQSQPPIAPPIQPWVSSAAASSGEPTPPANPIVPAQPPVPPASGSAVPGTQNSTPIN